MSRYPASPAISRNHIYAKHELLALDDLLGELHRVVIDSEAGLMKSTKSESILGWAGVLGLTVGWAMSALVSSGRCPALGMPALGVLLCGVICITISAFRSAMQTVREWRSFEKDTVGAVGENMARWYEVVCKIRQTYSSEQISFAKRYVSDVAVQARGRLSLFVGALEKVGVIPLLASAALTLANFNRDGSIPIAWCTAAAVAGLVYFFAMRLVDIAFMMERFALILDEAAKSSASAAP